MRTENKYVNITNLNSQALGYVFILVEKLPNNVKVKYCFYKVMLNLIM